MFHPDRRVGSRQKFCVEEQCQRERKRVYQRRWRATHPSDGGGRRLREALTKAGTCEERHLPRPREPLARIPWDEIEAELGAPTSLVLMCVAGVVVRWLVRFQNARGGGDSDDAVA